MLTAMGFLAILTLLLRWIIQLGNGSILGKGLGSKRNKFKDTLALAQGPLPDPFQGLFNGKELFLIARREKDGDCAGAFDIRMTHLIPDIKGENQRFRRGFSRAFR